MDKKVTGIVAYITWIGWLVAFLAGDKEGAKVHLNQGLVLAILSVGSWLVKLILGGIPIIGFLIGIICAIVNLFVFVMVIIGIIYAATDKDAELPLVGAIKILK
ncbi:MAG: hypothetical protein IJ335_02355 [Lachnospiraceae bacterium]|nr:hypothetical protein [Lachnospiraceae bacterium]